ncbi:hypothetical protein [Candidatus Williamhamiltonella defendens]|uniref:hypothetical protein n=1 Tax=Candidatus Williamhamiltonella defendens TaxID=138072 RepID=UPI001F2BA123|nr:hypothetical protein [Candidatus Hamiltonella defensa]
MNIHTVRWVSYHKKTEWAEFTKKNEKNLALDGDNYMNYLALTLVSLQMVQ